MEKKINNLNSFLCQFYQETIDPIIGVDLNGQIISMNNAAEQYFGYKESELLGHEIEILVPNALQKHHKHLRENYQKNPISKSMGRNLKIQAKHKNGTMLDVDITLTVITIPSGQTVIAVLVRDIQTYRKHEKKILNIHNHDSLTGASTWFYLQNILKTILNNALLDNTLLALCVIDIDHFKQINDQYGHTTGDLILKKVVQRLKQSVRKYDIVTRFGGDEFILLLNNIPSINSVPSIIKKIQNNLSEHPYHVQKQIINISCSIGVSLFPTDTQDADILFQKADKAMYAAKEKNHNNSSFMLINYPEVTNTNTQNALLTFSQMRLHLQQMIANNPLISRHLFLISVNNFKRITHIYGYDIADQILELIKQRICLAMPNINYFFAQKNSNEFIVVCSSCDTKQIAKIARHILKHINKTLQIKHDSIQITACIGITSFPTDAQNTNDLLIHSDVALQYAQEKGENTFQTYSKQKAKTLKRKQILLNELQTALKNKEFFLTYQMQFDTIKKQAIGAEVLLRWRHPSLGIIHPEEFIPLIEDTQWIHLISDWVLIEACTQAKHWQKQIKNFIISVNISSNQLTSKIISSIKKALELSNLSPQSLELEITESKNINYSKSTKYVLNQLKKLNIHMACDDFGINFSSFNRLKELPLTTIKIHKDFIKKINPKHPRKTDTSHPSVEFIIISAILEIAKKLNLRVVIEGVTHKEQVTLLKQIGCHIVQGYFYSKPLTAKRISQIINRK